MKIRFVLLTLLVSAISLFLFNFFEYKKNTKPYIIINKQKIYVVVSDTPQARSQGLSGVKKLDDNRGMLFIFDTPAPYTFWMKDMNFNLDFIYIKNDQIVEIAENIPYPKTGEQPQVIIPKNQFDKVLEVNSGVVKRIGANVGQKVLFNLR